MKDIFDMVLIVKTVERATFIRKRTGSLAQGRGTGLPCQGFCRNRDCCDPIPRRWQGMRPCLSRSPPSEAGWRTPAGRRLSSATGLLRTLRQGFACRFPAWPWRGADCSCLPALRPVSRAVAGQRRVGGDASVPFPLCQASMPSAGSQPTEPTQLTWTVGAGPLPKTPDATRREAIVQSLGVCREGLCIMQSPSWHYVYPSLKLHH